MNSSAASSETTIAGSGLVLFAYDGSDLAKLAIDEAGRQLPAGRDALVLCVWQPADVGFVPARELRFDAAQASEVRKAAEETAAHGAELAEKAGFRAESMTVRVCVSTGLLHAARAQKQEHDRLVLGPLVLVPRRSARVAGRDARFVAQRSCGGHSTGAPRHPVPRRVWGVARRTDCGLRRAIVHYAPWISPPATLLIWFQLRSPELAEDFERLMAEDRDIVRGSLDTMSNWRLTRPADVPGQAIGQADYVLIAEIVEVERWEQQASEHVQRLADDLAHLVSSRGMLVVRSVL
jgi:hypothetical protein